MKPLQSIAKPRVLPRPIMPVTRVRRFEDERDVAFYLLRQLPPVELLPEPLLDLLLFLLKQVGAWLGVWSTHRQVCGDPKDRHPDGTAKRSDADGLDRSTNDRSRSVMTVPSRP